jgi:hypothetical protein
MYQPNMHLKLQNSMHTVMHKCIMRIIIVSISNVIPVHAMKEFGTAKVQIQLFLILSSQWKSLY